ncbi:hypothetical protein Z949_1997 [Sulfitobacter guttiformis KCTC 32187]|nr:hypothetical protein Z949_1997 [Sulfitobacter guttiformis KCTC 32187]
MGIMDWEVAYEITLVKGGVMVYFGHETLCSHLRLLHPDWGRASADQNHRLLLHRHQRRPR